jgi:uncharacterized protein YndB with AHSA1/START domain
MSMPTDREIVFTRVFDAPRGLVWKAWTDPARVVKWWGPRGFTNTTENMEVKPGGVGRYVMRGPDGTDYPNRSKYKEVKEPERLVYKHGGAADTEPVNFQTTVTFDEEGAGRTRVTMRAIFPSERAREFVVKTYGAAEGGKQHLARLGEHLASLAGDGGGDEGGEAFLISRVFRAPVEAVYKAWTERDRLAKWFGPRGTAIVKSELDLRTGGVYLYCMRGTDGKEMWGRWVFLEIATARRLVFTCSFSNEKGDEMRAPWEENWPLRWRSEVMFEPHAGKGLGTVVTVRWSTPDAAEVERRAFDAGREGMNRGWGGTFDRLDEYLAPK